MQAYTPPRKTFGFLGNNWLITFGLGVVVMTVVLISIFTWANNKVAVAVDGKQVKVSMLGGRVADALDKAGVKLKERDLVSPVRDVKLNDGMVIKITRAKTVIVTADGQTKEILTPVLSVAEVLKEVNIALGPMDRVEPGLETKISAGDVVRVIRVSEKFTYNSYKLAYQTERRNDSNLERGITKVLREGQEGLGQRTIKIVMEDGKEVRREEVGAKIVKQPVNKLIAMGTLRQKIVSRGGRPIRFSRVMTMEATGYTYTGSRTASGVAPYRGAIAVDPDVISFGTKMYIEGYGYAKALDTGGAIKGSRIDLFFESESEARRWGRRDVKVYILD